MTVFKGYMLMAKKNLGTILLYFGIFVGIAMATAAANDDSTTKNFEAKKLSVEVVDQDDSELSGIVIDYLKKNHKVTLSGKDNRELYEELYYGKISVVIRIPKGFGANGGEGEYAMQLTNSPGSYSGIYLMQQLNQMVFEIEGYQQVGYTLEEAYQNIKDEKKASVKMLEDSSIKGENERYSSFLQCVPYMFIAGIGTSVAMILHKFRRRQVKNRMMVSSVSLFRQNVEAVLAIFLVGIGVLALTVVATVMRYGSGFLESAFLPYYLLNMFINMLLALAIAFLVGMLVEKEEAISMILTSMSLALSFLGAVFVPLELFSSGMKIVAKFMPTYWYEVVNDLLMRYSNISGNVKTQLWQGFGMQFLFVVAIFGIGLVIAKHKQQES